MRVFVLLALFGLSACVTPPKIPPISCEEKCALDGMICTGKTMSQVQASSLGAALGASGGYNYGGNTNAIIEQVQCAKDQSKTKEILANQEMAKNKIKYDELGCMNFFAGTAIKTSAQREHCPMLKESILKN